MYNDGVMLNKDKRKITMFNVNCILAVLIASNAIFCKYLSGTYPPTSLTLIIMTLKVAL